MLHARGLGKAYRGSQLFHSLDFQINDRDRIGLIGENGTGKSTLMKMLVGLVSPDEGEIIGPKDLTCGYLPQDGLFVRGRTVFEEAISVFEELRGLEKECRQLEQELSDIQHSGAEYEKKLDRYASASHRFSLQGGYALEARVGSVLHGLGFSRSSWTRPCEEFSGGWQMRIALAKLLLQQPKLLLLDEPTNHLDLEARNWLEDYLQGYKFAVVLVSHDRYFLDSTIGRVLEISERTVHFYQGNYGDFVRQREQRLAQMVAAYKAQQKEIARIKAFADRFRYQATKAAQVQSRLKDLERMERIEIPPKSKPIRLKFPKGPRTGRAVLDLSDVTAGYGGEPVFRDLNLILEKGERVALVGPNGAGKSTLMKILAGRLPLTKGERREGNNVIVSYYSQDQDDLLVSNKTVWDEVFSVAPNYIVPQLRTLLGCFLFSRDSIEKPVSVLSGGERSRLVFCKLLLSPANCLLLDEPTNHLDIRSKDILMSSLCDYEGTMVFVSHDRYFLDGLATRVLEVGNSTAATYLGNYEDYLAKKNDEVRREKEEALRGDEDSLKAGTDAKRIRERRRSNRRVNPYKIKELKGKIERVEATVETHETRVSVLSKMLCSEELYRDFSLFRATMEEHDRLKEELAGLMAQWETLQSDLAILSTDS